MPIDIDTLQSLKIPTNLTRLHLPDGKYWIHFALPDNVTCEDLKDVTAANWELQMNPLTWFSSETVKNILGVGFGYNEDLIGCYVLYKVIPLSSYFITSMDFGITPGVVESFGLFKKRMDSLHDYNIEFMKVMFRSNYTEPYIDYYVPPQSVGDAVHRRLLHSFWKLVVTPHDSKMGVVLPMPLTKLPRLYPGKMIPYIDSESCSHVNDIPWYATSALATLSKHFQSAVLTHAEWTLLKSVAAQKYYAATNKTNIHQDIRLDIIIDYTDWLPYNPVVFGSTRCDHKWEAIEAELIVLNRQRAHPLENVMAKTLLFAVENKNDGGFSVNVDREFAKRMSSRVTIATLNIVNSRQFENNVRPKLEEMKAFRSIILAKHPEADVYFQLRFDLNILDYYATVFCNREALSLHEQIEGISNWALFNAIPLIIGRAFDDVNHGVFQTWFSVLRPTLENFRDVNPYLVVRNYPKIRDTMDLEPCIEWTKERPALSLTYFHNNYIGSSFDATNMRKDRPITRDEYEILLQFILHRFDLVEVLLAKDSYKNFVRALDKLATDGLIDEAKKFLILFDHGDFSEQEQLETFYSFLNFTKVTLGNNIEFIQGITYGLGAFLEQTENMSYEEFMNATYHRHTMIVGWGQTFNLTMGVFMGIDNCEQLLLQSKKSNDFITEPFLRNAEYIVCHQNMDLNKYNKTKTLGEFLDRNLYIKKITDAFGEESFPKNGWWKITNYSDLAVPSVYLEKYSAFLGSQTWWPTSPSIPTANSTNDKQIVVLVVTFSFLILLIFALGLSLWYHKNKTIQYLSNEEEYEFRNGLKIDANQYPYNKQLEIPKEEFRFDQSKHIGSGTFGRVYKMKVGNFESEVAVKIPQLSVGKDAILGALQEIKILTFIGTHENVIRILGAYTKEIKLGDVPYPTMTWDDDFILKLEQGLRPIKPVRSSDEVYKLMECCWNITPNLRPTFAELREMFSNLKIYAYQQEALFSQSLISVTFDPFVSLRDVGIPNAYNVDDLIPMVSKISSRFSKMLVTLIHPKQAFSAKMIPSAVALFNKLHRASNQPPMEVSITFPMTVVGNGSTSTSFDFAKNIADDANKIYSGTVKRLFLEYWQLSASRKNVEDAKRYFTYIRGQLNETGYILGAYLPFDCGTETTDQLPEYLIQILPFVKEVIFANSPGKEQLNLEPYLTTRPVTWLFEQCKHKIKQHDERISVSLFTAWTFANSTADDRKLVTLKNDTDAKPDENTIPNWLIGVVSAVVIVTLAIIVSAVIWRVLRHKLKSNNINHKDIDSLYTNTSDTRGEGLLGSISASQKAAYDTNISTGIRHIWNSIRGSAKRPVSGMISEIKVLSHLGEHEKLVNLVGAYTKEIRKGNLIITQNYENIAAQ
ncbi:Macrophage colony-stimulating factor 1 receptor [Orchesella cincta]|uniref:Macrophage colony-stimulating factor 1 receptor n=1 Tax=Orchesella cincta TaxID=48709 RepID=A0A1D2MBD8_ORCCI|nr:Macrophage colony-stimulating factor 1 receptor [Orchesella cincta]